MDPSRRLRDVQNTMIERFGDDTTALISELIDFLAREIAIEEADDAIVGHQVDTDFHPL